MSTAFAAYRPVEIHEVQALAQSHGLEQIVVWHFRTGEGQHVTTWGEVFRHSLLAAEAGNHIKRAAQWPAHYCTDLPASLTTLFTAADVELAGNIRSGALDKRTVLATLLVLRDVIGERDPRLAEALIPRACEAAEKGAA